MSKQPHPTPITFPARAMSELESDQVLATDPATAPAECIYSALRLAFIEPRQRFEHLLHHAQARALLASVPKGNPKP